MTVPWLLCPWAVWVLEGWWFLGDRNKRWNATQRAEGEDPISIQNFELEEQEVESKPGSLVGLLNQARQRSQPRTSLGVQQAKTPCYMKIKDLVCYS